MKLLSCIILSLLLGSCARPNDRVFTGSTPAGNEVRIFLGIPLTDSIDFIRWKLELRETTFELTCNYGIGKPNTNGFYNGGTEARVKGKVKKDLFQLQLQNGENSIGLVEINDDLLHFLDPAGRPLSGNGGWSYTLNNTAPVITSDSKIAAMPLPLEDSMVYVGRTPCAVPGIGVSKDCYKLKWKIVLYPNATKNGPGRYVLYGTNWRKEPLAGDWDMRISTGKVTYTLKDAGGKALIHLLTVGKIVLFTDAEGKLLVGNEDFSYTLNRL